MMRCDFVAKCREPDVYIEWSSHGDKAPPQQWPWLAGNCSFFGVFRCHSTLSHDISQQRAKLVTMSQLVVAGACWSHSARSGHWPAVGQFHFERQRVLLMILWLGATHYASIEWDQCAKRSDKSRS